VPGSPRRGGTNCRRQGPGRLNALIPPRELGRTCDLAAEAEKRLATISADHGLTGRGFHGAVRVARSIADLDGSAQVEERHLLEACAYRGA
jgi:magnesium chelatase family protein